MRKMNIKREDMMKVKLHFVAFLILVCCFSINSQEQSQKSINSLEEVTLGDVKQWILIRGEDVTDPIFLFLHGGPGFANMPFAHIDSPRLEKHFVVVHWDQRGAGKSFDQNIPKETMNLEQFLSDTHELINLLRKRFSKEKIFLLGYSWGSILGLYTVHRHPEYIHAYVGMGQVANMNEGDMVSHKYTVKKAKEAGDKSSAKMLDSIGPPPYEGGFQSLLMQRMLLARYGGSMRNISFNDLEKYRKASPFYSEADNRNFMRAYMFTQNLMRDEMMEVDFFTDVLEVKVPAYFFTGRFDYQVPYKVLERYFKVLKAPHKEIVWFEDSAHFITLDEPEVYQDRLINLVLKNTLKK
jgi:pimeloyl-ACP methyl ester carboxylesterase